MPLTTLGESESIYSEKSGSLMSKTRKEIKWLRSISKYELCFILCMMPWLIEPFLFQIATDLGLLSRSVSRSVNCLITSSSVLKENRSVLFLIFPSFSIRRQLIFFVTIICKNLQVEWGLFSDRLIKHVQFTVHAWFFKINCYAFCLKKITPEIWISNFSLIGQTSLDVESNFGILHLPILYCVINLYGHHK